MGPGFGAAGHPAHALVFGQHMEGLEFHPGGLPAFAAHALRSGAIARAARLLRCISRGPWRAPGMADAARTPNWSAGATGDGYQSPPCLRAACPAADVRNAPV